MKIICIGRNYAAHAAELGNDLPAEPLFFLKPTTALLPSGQPFLIPKYSNEVHYELELVLTIKKTGKDISEEEALDYIESFTIGLDMTARDVQTKLKAKGQPWEKAKAFDGSAILANETFPWESFNLAETRFQLQQNGHLVQDGDPNLLLFPIPRVIAHVSSCMTIEAGDLLFTGTPKGVGRTVNGDRLDGYLNGKQLLSVAVE